ncbi:GNAT family N-acetyltransferase [Paractinoplanes durhamensis]|uniref:N-acetyltransferase n=1 Tax=Paractinoplanes durhamensis TaxID=113563 RepID=A0ABQ3Z9R8_9ACTN|nr:GNAT family N-acetyltransferase [Actinoplanes durhamensis]GIE06559.1 N-acetyltransferase [Actinoplanes durhamensis]
MTLTTERLLLRQWRAADREPFAEMNADPVVMRHFPSRLTRAQSDAMADQKEAAVAEQGWGLWAVEIKDTGDFAGFIGLQAVPAYLSFAPAIEIGWRLGARFHGVGYATEGARDVRAYAFEVLGLPGLVSMTSALNTNSRRVMEKLGMTHDPAEDFDYPTDPPDWSGRRHVLYRLAA